MSSYTIDHKYRSRYASTRTAGSSNIAILLGVFNKTVIPLALVGYGIVITNTALPVSLAIYHLISNAHSFMEKCDRFVNTITERIYRLVG